MKALTLWNHHTPGIEEALRRCGDDATVIDVAQEVVSGYAQVWGNHKALIITKLYGDCIHFWIATGEKEAVIKLSNDILAWGRDHGFTKATLTGRKGWVRALQQEGWRQQAVLMEKPINGEGQGQDSERAAEADR